MRKTGVRGLWVQEGLVVMEAKPLSCFALRAIGVDYSSEDSPRGTEYEIRAGAGSCVTPVMPSSRLRLLLLGITHLTPSREAGSVA